LGARRRPTGPWLQPDFESRLLEGMQIFDKNKKRQSSSTLGSLAALDLFMAKPFRF
jgi:hypothetical protein